jgi:hypothetical protein
MRQKHVHMQQKSPKNFGQTSFFLWKGFSSGQSGITSAKLCLLDLGLGTDKDYKTDNTKIKQIILLNYLNKMYSIKRLEDICHKLKNTVKNCKLLK